MLKRLNHLFAAIRDIVFEWCFDDSIAAILEDKPQLNREQDNEQCLQAVSEMGRRSYLQTGHGWNGRL